VPEYKKKSLMPLFFSSVQFLINIIESRNANM